MVRGMARGNVPEYSRNGARACALYRHFDKDASDKLTHGFLQFRDQAIVYFETFRF